MSDTNTRAGLRTGREPSIPKAAAPPAFRGHQLLFLMAVIAIACLPPMLTGEQYGLGLMNNVLLYSILTLGFYWCFSLSGLFSFAVFGFYAVGAYVSIWVANHFGGFWTGLLAAMLSTAVIGALTKITFSRCSMIYFAIATLALGSTITLLFAKWEGFTGGFSGTSEIVSPSLFGLDLSGAASLYYLSLAVLGLFLLLTIFFFRSAASRDLAFVRRSIPVAAVNGLRTQRVQVTGFAVGSAMQGAAGSLYAHGSGYVSVDAFNVDVALLVLLMLLLGGMGSIYGPVLGAIALVYLPEQLRDLQTYSTLIYSVAILAVVVVFPGGLAGIRQSVSRRINARRK